MPEPALHPRVRPSREARASRRSARRDARELLREASLELARLRRIRGASHRTWRRIARAQAQLAFAASLLAAGLAEPAAALDPVLRHPIPAGRPVFTGIQPYLLDPTFADIDGDGDLDLLVGEYGGNVVFFENTGSSTQAVFGPPQTNPFGLVDVGSRADLSLADLDGDGDLDALVGTLGTNYTPQVRFFSNTGTASAPAFAAPVANPFGLAAFVTELADIDGDGDADALRPVFPGAPFGGQPSGLVLHENTGSASAPAFAAGVTSPFGLAYFVRAFADMDGDGDLDAFSGGISWFENTGSPTSPAFAAPVSQGVDVPSERMDVADLDGDGDLDAVAAGYDVELEDYTSAWVQNIGTPDAPVFTTLGNPFGLGPGGAASLADLDGDGDLDAFLGDTLFEANVGSATAPAFQRVPVATLALSGQDPVLADLDADGDPDALVGLVSGDLRFFENGGSPSQPDFLAPVTNPFGLANVGAYASPALADLDGDGDLDALVGNAAGELRFFPNGGSAAAPAFAPPVVNPFGLASVAGDASPGLADLDADGDLDAVVGVSTGVFVFFRNTGTANAPAFAAPSTNPFGLVDIGAYTAPGFADIDGDGDYDCITGRNGSTVLLRNTGSASAPAFATLTGLVSGGSHSAPALEDLDADGDLDLVIGTLGGGVSYRPNTGTPTEHRFITQFDMNPFGVFAREPELADLDADGDLDLFSGANFIGNTFRGPNWYENTGSASTPGFGLLVTQPFGLPMFAFFGGEAAALAAVDLDADGDLDALIGKSDGNLVFVPNTGSASAPAFGAPTTNPFGLAGVGFAASPELADLDGDGDLDALVGAYGGNTFFLENTGSAAAPAFAAALVNPFGLAEVGRFARPEIADIDGDGDLDVLVNDDNGRNVLFENIRLDPEACTDGLDNDADGVLDLAGDPGCSNAGDTDEGSPVQCDNGEDDDADGRVDWRGDGTGDSSCTSLTDSSEFSAPPTGCGLGPELLLLAPLAAAARRRRERVRP